MRFLFIILFSLLTFSDSFAATEISFLTDTISINRDHDNVSIAVRLNRAARNRVVVPIVVR